MEFTKALQDKLISKNKDVTSSSSAQAIYECLADFKGDSGLFELKGVLREKLKVSLKSYITINFKRDNNESTIAMKAIIDNLSNNIVFDADGNFAIESGKIEGLGEVFCKAVLSELAADREIQAVKGLRGLLPVEDTSKQATLLVGLGLVVPKQVPVVDSTHVNDAPIIDNSGEVNDAITEDTIIISNVAGEGDEMKEEAHIDTAITGGGRVGINPQDKAKLKAAQQRVENWLGGTGEKYPKLKEDLGIVIALSQPNEPLFDNLLKKVGVTKGMDEKNEDILMKIICAQPHFDEMKNYADIRKDSWVSSFGSRTFLISLYEHNPNIFQKPNEILYKLVESTMNTSEKGHKRGIFASNSKEQNIKLNEMLEHLSPKGSDKTFNKK
jgi:hypothetical protein